MRNIFRGLAALGCLVVLAMPLLAQVPVDPSQLGPKVGEKALPFTLPDQTGVPRELASLAGPKGTMLVFFRSAHW